MAQQQMQLFLQLRHLNQKAMAMQQIYYPDQLFVVVLVAARLFVVRRLVAVRWPVQPAAVRQLAVARQPVQLVAAYRPAQHFVVHWLAVHFAVR